MQVNHRKRLRKELSFIVASFIFALFLVQSGAVAEFISATEGMTALAAFITGIFFTSVFTIAPASIALAKIAEQALPAEVALWGALGAMFGDLVIFLLIRDTIGEDVVYAVRHSKYKRILSHLNLGIVRFLAPIIGGLLIASPFPDEFGLAVLGITRIKVSVLLPLVFVLNFFNIYIISVIAQNV
jgi:hypothetical protein